MELMRLAGLYTTGRDPFRRGTQKGAGTASLLPVHGSIVPRLNSAVRYTLSTVDIGLLDVCNQETRPVLREPPRPTSSEQDQSRVLGNLDGYGMRGFARLPRTTTGGILRSHLPSPYRPRMCSVDEHAGPTADWPGREGSKTVGKSAKGLPC